MHTLKKPFTLLLILSHLNAELWCAHDFWIIEYCPLFTNIKDTNDVNIISRAIKLRGKLQAKQDLALKQGNDYYDYITGEVNIPWLSNISMMRS
jgi:hypothetical protein